jgi:ketosteroid isomerase-like protein
MSREELIELVRSTLHGVEISEKWDVVVDPSMPRELVELQAELVDAYRRADVEWLLEHTDPEIEIVQPAELPGRKTYRGRDGLLDALSDWPREWEAFAIEPKRVFAVGDDQVVIAVVHRGKPSAMDIEVAAEFVWLMRWRDRCMTSWTMYMTVPEAVAAAERR